MSSVWFRLTLNFTIVELPATTRFVNPFPPRHSHDTVFVSSSIRLPKSPVRPCGYKSVYPTENRLHPHIRCTEPDEFSRKSQVVIYVLIFKNFKISRKIHLNCDSLNMYTGTLRSIRKNTILVPFSVTLASFHSSYTIFESVFYQDGRSRKN